MTETNGVCVVCGRPEWTTAVALSGKVSPFNACHRVKGDPITFNTIDCYKTGYQNRSAQLTRAHAEGKAEGRRERVDDFVEQAIVRLCGTKCSCSLARDLRSLIPAAPGGSK